jgi:hypothetical protein
MVYFLLEIDCENVVVKVVSREESIVRTERERRNLISKIVIRIVGNNGDFVALLVSVRLVPSILYVCPSTLIDDARVNQLNIHRWLEIYIVGDVSEDRL